MYVWRDEPAHEHGVEHDPQAPHVRCTPRVLGVRPDKRKKTKISHIKGICNRREYRASEFQIRIPL
jgi:hypothetical protein